MAGKKPQQWQSIFGYDEFVDVSGINDSGWKDEPLAPDVVGVIVVPIPEEGIKVSLDGGVTFIPLLRAVKTGAEFDFQDRFPIATASKDIKAISFQSLTTAGPHTIKLIKRHEG